MQLEEELKRLTISNNKNMGIIEELTKANETLKTQIKALSSDTQLPQKSVVNVVFSVIYIYIYSPRKGIMTKLWFLSTLGFRFICFSYAVYSHFSLEYWSIHISGSICFCSIHPDESRWWWVCSCHKEEKKRKFVVNLGCFYSVAFRDGTMGKFRFQKSRKAGFYRLNRFYFWLEWFLERILLSLLKRRERS